MKQRAVEKEHTFFHMRKSSFFHLRKSTRKRAESKSLLVNTRQTLTEGRLLLSKNVFILVVFTNIKQSSLCSSSALCAETLFRLHSLRSLSLHFEEAFVVVVVSEEARFCLRSLFLVV